MKVAKSLEMLSTKQWGHRMSKSYTFTVEWKDPVIVVAGDIDEAHTKLYNLIQEKINHYCDDTLSVKLDHVGNFYDDPSILGYWQSGGDMHCKKCSPDTVRPITLDGYPDGFTCDYCCDPILPAVCTHSWYEVEGHNGGSMQCSHCDAYQN